MLIGHHIRGGGRTFFFKNYMDEGEGIVQVHSDKEGIGIFFCEVDDFNSIIQTIGIYCYLHQFDQLLCS